MLLLTLTVAANQYAVDVVRVVEVIPRVELRTIPHAPVPLAGFLGYRGSVVPVLDLGLLLGSAPSRDCLSTRIILVDDRVGDSTGRDHSDDAQHPDKDPVRTKRPPTASLLGLIAERVIDLTYAQADRIMRSPVDLPEAPYLGAIIQINQGFVQLIVVEQIRAAALPSSPPVQDVALDGMPGCLH